MWIPAVIISIREAQAIGSHQVKDDWNGKTGDGIIEEGYGDFSEFHKMSRIQESRNMNKDTLDRDYLIKYEHLEL